MATKYSASPTPVTMKHSPFQAAQELRSRLQYLAHNNPASGSKLSQIKRREIEKYLLRIDESLLLIAGQREPLVEAAKARKSGQVQERIADLYAKVNNVAYNLSMLRSQIAQIPIKEAVAVEYQLLYELAQCLPTVEDLPKTEAENTLRAIIALLRHHRWPGVETVTQNGKEEPDGKASIEKLAAEVGPPAAVGGPVVAEDGGDGDEEYDEDS